MADINDLLQRRNMLIEEGRGIYDAAEAEKRELSDEEKANDDARYAEIDQLTEAIDRREKQVAAESLIEDIPVPAAKPAVDERVIEKASPAEDEFRSYLRTGEVRALSAGIDAEGGYTVPEVFQADLLRKVDDLVFIRQRATKYSLGVGESLGFPSLENDPADATWVSELATGALDSTMSFGNRELRPHPLAQKLKVSKKLVRSSAINVQSEVRNRLAYKFGITQEKGFLTGSGAGQPLGLLTASADGISTSRDVSTGNTTTSITFDGLLEAQYSLKGQYWARADWLFHRDALKQIRKLKDGEGQYIWQPGGQAGQPNMLLGRPFMMSEYVSNTFTSGLYVGIIGDFSFFWIADALGMSIQVLNELYAEANQVGYIARLECDGMPVLEEAFARVKLG